MPSEQARALEGIGRSLLDHDLANAAAHLRQAPEIYEAIGAPGAQYIQETLEGHSL